MRRPVLALVLVAGCYRPDLEPPCTVTCTATSGCPGSQVCLADGLCHAEGGGCSDDTDAGTDAPAELCLGRTSGLLRFCGSVPIQGVLVLDGAIDTLGTACTAYQPPGGGPELCVVFAEAIQVVNLRATGARPLLLSATTTIHVTGELDVSSKRNEARGAGGPYMGCGFPASPATDQGAAGGSFQGRGGAGGGVAGAQGPIGATPQTPTFIRGGCNGGIGSNNNVAQPSAGGGAVYLIAGGTITIDGRINASGAGGQAGIGGGNGGGSGGLIGLDGAQVMIGGQVFANGGGGASGYVLSMSEHGANPTAPDAPALGGTNPSDGGSGGRGGYLGDNDGAPGVGVTGKHGGGGGGGVGWVFLPMGTIWPVGNVSPAPQLF